MWADEPCVGTAPVSVTSRPTVTNATDPTQCGVVELEYGLERQWPGDGPKKARGSAGWSATKVALFGSISVKPPSRTTGRPLSSSSFQDLGVAVRTASSNPESRQRSRSKAGSACQPSWAA